MNTAAALPQLGRVDWLLLGVLALSVLVGLVRGLLFEVLSLLGWVAAYVAAQLWGGEVAPHVPVGVAGSALNDAAGFVVAFIAVLLLWSLGTRLLRWLVHATPLKLADRVLGATFGLLRGALVLLALATIVAMTPAAREPAWQASRGAGWLHGMLLELKPVLPAHYARYLPA